MTGTPEGSIESGFMLRLMVCSGTIAELACSLTIPHGTIDEYNCGRHAVTNETACPVECDDGYRKHIGLQDNWLVCTADGTWIPSSTPLEPITVDEVCELKLCSSLLVLANVNTTSECPRTIGSVCDFICNQGYQKTVPNITCQESTQWSPRYNLCILPPCSSEVPNGRFLSTCSHRVGSSCEYACNDGYKRYHSSPRFTITCEATSTWNTEPRLLCSKIAEESSTSSSSTQAKMASTTKPHGPSSNLGVILGCVIGGVVLIGIIFVLILVCYMRKRRRRKRYSNNEKHQREEDTALNRPKLQTSEL